MHGVEALDTLVLSGTESAADVLAANDLAEEAGCDLTVAPLFETIADLRARAGDPRRAARPPGLRARGSPHAVGG